MSEATAALQKEIADLKAAKPAAETAKPEAAAAVVDPKDPEPVEADFDSYPEFIRASARWAVRQDRREAEAAAVIDRETKRQAEIATEFQARTSTWATRRDTYVTAHPEREEALYDFLGTVNAGTPIGDAIMDSDTGAELADYLAQHPDEAERIARLSPVSALRALGKLEATLSLTTSASAITAGPAAKLLTTAPAIPTTLHSRSADPADRVKAAVERGDFSAFESEENAKALSASR